LLSARHYQLLAVEAPNVPEAELKTAIRWRLKEMIDYPVDQATVDVIDIPMNKEAPVKVRNVFAAVARNQFIEQHQNAYADADIPLSAIDLPEMAQRNISALAEPEGRGLAMLSFSDEGGLLTITFAGDLYLTRRIDVTFAQLLSPQADAQNASFDKITLELQRSLDHFDRQYHYVGLSKLMLAPLADAGPRLHAYLAANLYMPVEMLALDSVLDFSAVPELQQSVAQQRFFLVLGAALRQEQVAA
jgi:MSHA biogenesis protein MshI